MCGRTLSFEVSRGKGEEKRGLVKFRGMSSARGFNSPNVEEKNVLNVNRIKSTNNYFSYFVKLMGRNVL